MFCLEFSGLHYCLFVKVLFLSRSVSFEEHLFCFSESLFIFIISSSVCQELFHFIFKFLSKPGCSSLAATVHYFIRTFCSCQAVFYFLNFFSEIRVAFVRRNSHKVYQDCLSMSSSFELFRSPCYSRLPQQIEILPAFSRSVNSFLKLFWPGVNARLLSTDSPAGMEAASGKTANELEQHRKTPAKSGITTSFLQTFSTMAVIPDILSGKLLL